jgi:hypothetical protein
MITGKDKKTFVSKTSWEEAEYIARYNAYIPTGRVRNKRGEYVVFARSLF